MSTSKRKVIALGKIEKGVREPLRVFSAEKMREQLFLPVMKVVSEVLSTTVLQYKINYQEQENVEDGVEVVRNAIMSAITSPYLRAVVALFFHENTVTLRVVHPTENQMSGDEIVGALLLAYQHLNSKSVQPEVYFQEANATHILEGTVFAETLVNRMEEAGKPEVLVINVYHDYLRAAHNLSDLEPILQTIKALRGACAT